MGTGDAILKTKKHIKDKFFLLLLPDDLIIKKNCSKSMISIHNRYKSSVMASMKVNKKTVSRWGIYKLGKKIDKRARQFLKESKLDYEHGTGHGVGAGRL